MGPVQADIEAMRAVTVAREYGSGGGEVAARLSRRLGWSLVDREVVGGVAQRLGVTAEDALHRDERVEGIVARVLASFQGLQTGWVSAPPPSEAPSEEAYHEAVRRVLTAAVEAGPAVLVGRGGQALFRDRRDVLRVLVVAPLDARVRYVMRREGGDEAEALARIRRTDTDRTAYIRRWYKCEPYDVQLYDLVVNTGVLRLGSVVGLIVDALAAKASKLTVPADQLGPGTGLSPYPDRPRESGQSQ